MFVQTLPLRRSGVCVCVCASARSFPHLLCYLAGHFLSEVPVLADSVKELSSLHHLHDDQQPGPERAQESSQQGWGWASDGVFSRTA